MRIAIDLPHMVAERVTPSPRGTPPGPDSAFNNTGLWIPGSMAPHSSISNTGVRTNLNPGLQTLDSGLGSEDNG